MKKQREVWNIEKIQKYIDTFGDGTIILEEKYINNTTQMKFKCGKCNKTFFKNLTTIQQVGKCLCNSCSKKQSWKTIRKNFTIKDIENDFSKYGYQLLDNELKLLRKKYSVQDKYGYRGNITLRDAMLGKHFSTFSAIYNYNNLLYNTNLIVQQNNCTTEVLDWFSKNKNLHNHNIKLICKCECGKYFYPTLLDFSFQNRWRCKSCTNVQSIIERKVETECLKYCSKDNIITQKTYDKCRSDITNYPLKFDIYLIEQNILIEVDGNQHKDYRRYGGYNKYKTKEEQINAFEKQKHYDNIKDNFAKENNIKLIRISEDEVNNKKYKDIVQSIFMQ